MVDVISTTRPSVRRRTAQNYLACLLATALLICVAAILARQYLLASIAPRITGNASFDQKMLLLARNGFGTASVSVVTGSSMALNNVDTDTLQSAEGRPFLNLSAWGLTLTDTMKLFLQVADAIPVREVTLAVQAFEITDEQPQRFAMADADMHNVISGNIWPVTLKYFDFPDALKQKYYWQTNYGDPHNYFYLGFTPTGFVPLDIYGPKIDPNRWNPPQQFLKTCADCMHAIARFCTLAKERKLPFFLILPPLTHFIREARYDIRSLYEDRRARLQKTLADCDGQFFDTGEVADFEDSCFADFAHLNAEAAARLAELYVQWRAGEFTSLRPQSTPRHARAGARRSLQQHSIRARLPELQHISCFARASGNHSGEVHADSSGTDK